MVDISSILTGPLDKYVIKGIRRDIDKHIKMHIYLGMRLNEGKSRLRYDKPLQPQRQSDLSDLVDCSGLP